MTLTNATLFLTSVPRYFGHREQWPNRRGARRVGSVPPRDFPPGNFVDQSGKMRQGKKVKNGKCRGKMEKGKRKVRNN